MDGVEDERVTDAMELSWFIMEISKALVDLAVFLIWNIPRHPKSA
jgi:hypothetical protein